MLFTESNPKLEKGEDLGYLSFGLHFAPHTISGYQVCASASDGCASACLYTSGHGRFTRTQESRIAKTKRFFEARNTFLFDMIRDIRAAIRRADRMNFAPAFRLNLTSDLRWEAIRIPASIGSTEPLANYYPNIMTMFPEVQFYDYTKHPSRKLEGKTAGNYDLTYSFSAVTPKPISIKGLQNPANRRTAVVFDKRENIPESFRGWPVVDGDDTDVRHIEPARVVVALYAKGRARSDTSGFVQIKGRDY
jgi:hypothetical protein